MRGLALLVVLGGCSAWFGLDTPTRFSDASTADAPLIDVGIDASRLRACPPQNMASTLLACFDFDGDVKDATGNLSVLVSNVTYVPGQLGMAARFGIGTAITIPDTPLLDTSEVTMEAFIRPAQLPVVARMAIWDTDFQYGMFILADGTLRCENADATNAVSANTWTHVACTVGASGTKIYINGLVRVTAGGGVNVGSMNGAAIGRNVPSGDEFVGDMDLLRVYRVVRTPAEICVAAGACD